MTNLIVFGLSGSGKTFFCDRAKELACYKPIHAIGTIKRMYEELYKLPVGSLDTNKGKNFVPEGMKISVGKLLVNLYHFWLENDPYYSSRMLLPELNKIYNSGDRFCLNGLRSLTEGEMINKSFHRSEITAIWIKNHITTSRSSDYQQYEVFKRLNAKEKYEITNTLDYHVFDEIILTLSQD